MSMQNVIRIQVQEWVPSHCKCLRKDISPNYESFAVDRVQVSCIHYCCINAYYVELCAIAFVG
jgi:hypothetical protein